MRKETYESPKMTFEEVVVDNAVANTCWGHHSDGAQMYCDINGKEAGFIGFQINNGSCTLVPINVVYYEGKENNRPTNGRPLTNDEWTKFNAIVSTAGGSTGNSYAGDAISDDITKVS